MDTLFHGEPLPDTSSSGLMLAHMEMAIRRAQDEGKLPKMSTKGQSLVLDQAPEL